MYNGCGVLPLSCLQRFCVVLGLLDVQPFLCGVAATFFTAVAVWHCPYPVHTACCVALPLSNLQRLLCDIASLFTAVAVWHCPFPVYSACCVALPPSCLQPVLCGCASILCTAVAVWHCPYPVSAVNRIGTMPHSHHCTEIEAKPHSSCCVALPLSCLQRSFCVVELTGVQGRGGTETGS